MRSGGSTGWKEMHVAAWNVAPPLPWEAPVRREQPPPFSPCGLSLRATPSLIPGTGTHLASLIFVSQTQIA